MEKFTGNSQSTTVPYPLGDVDVTFVYEFKDGDVVKLFNDRIFIANPDYPLREVVDGKVIEVKVSLPDIR